MRCQLTWNLNWPGSVRRGPRRSPMSRWRRCWSGRCPSAPEPPTVEQIDVLAEPPTGHRGEGACRRCCGGAPRRRDRCWLGVGRPTESAVVSDPDPDLHGDCQRIGWPSLRPRRYRGRRSGPGDDGDGEEDVYLVREGSSPRRITGSDSDLTDEICPAFSPDGLQLAFGQATVDSDTGYSGDGAVVITDLSAEGVRTATTTIALAGATHPPCAIWSADGRWLAFGVESPAGTRPADRRRGLGGRH